MSRAELRRKQRETQKANTATYNLTDIVLIVERNYYYSTQILRVVEDTYVKNVVIVHGYHIRLLISDSEHTRL